MYEAVVVFGINCHRHGADGLSIIVGGLEQQERPAAVRRPRARPDALHLPHPKDLCSATGRERRTKPARLWERCPQRSHLNNQFASAHTECSLSLRRHPPASPPLITASA